MSCPGGLTVTWSLHFPCCLMLSCQPAVYVKNIPVLYLNVAVKAKNTHTASSSMKLSWMLMLANLELKAWECWWRRGVNVACVASGWKQSFFSSESLFWFYWLHLTLYSYRWPKWYLSRSFYILMVSILKLSCQFSFSSTWHAHVLWLGLGLMLCASGINYPRFTVFRLFISANLSLTCCGC